MLYVKLCQDWFGVFLGGGGEFMVWWLVWRVKRRRIELFFSPDVVLCGWLGSKYQLPTVIMYICVYIAKQVSDWPVMPSQLHWSYQGKLLMPRHLHQSCQGETRYININYFIVKKTKTTTAAKEKKRVCWNAFAWVAGDVNLAVNVL